MNEPTLVSRAELWHWLWQMGRPRAVEIARMEGLPDGLPVPGWLDVSAGEVVFRTVGEPAKASVGDRFIFDGTLYEVGRSPLEGLRDQKTT